MCAPLFLCFGKESRRAFVQHKQRKSLNRTLCGLFLCGPRRLCRKKRLFFGPEYAMMETEENPKGEIRMKKILVLLLTLVLLFAAALPAFAVGDPSEEEGASVGIAEGYVRIKEVFKTQGGETTSTVRSYDKQGRLLKKVETYWSEGYANKTTTTYVYDKNGNVVKETEVAKNSQGTADRMVVTYTYNKKGKVVQEKVSAGSASHTLKYTYDKKGNLIKEINYFNSGILTSVWTYNAKGKVTKQVSRTDYEDNTWNKTVITCTYDKNGNQTKENYRNVSSDGSDEKKTLSDVYNSKGQHVKSTEVYSFVNGDRSYSSSTRWVTTYAYDSRGNLSKEVLKAVYDDSSRHTTATTYTYDGEDRVRRMDIVEQSDTGTAKSATTYTYDKNGSLIKEAKVYKDASGTEKTTDTYSYDKAGNLLKHVYRYQFPDNSAGKSVSTYTYQKIGA